MNPIYSRSSRLVRSKRAPVRQRGEGGIPLAVLAYALSKSKGKVQKGGWIAPQVRKPPDYDWIQTLQKQRRRKRR